MKNWTIRILENPQDMAAVEELQCLVWPGNDLEIAPAHVLLTAAHNGGIVLGAIEGKGHPFEDEATETPVQRLIGFVFGFPGLYATPDGPRLKHCSHMMGVHPEYRDQGIGFSLKRAQWQMVRQQGVDRITWTYDPLLSRNAYLNVTRLGAVCNTYRRNEYGKMRDELNRGLPSDRFQVDWWVYSQRVARRLSRRPRARLDVSHFLAAGAEIINPSTARLNGLPRPDESPLPAALENEAARPPLLLLEIPADFLALRAANLELALAWRRQTRTQFETLFELGYLVSDFIYQPGSQPRSFYVLVDGESTL
jgi:predicted GNAT superfamily acetyltransferase